MAGLASRLTKYAAFIEQADKSETVRDFRTWAEGVVRRQADRRKRYDSPKAKAILIHEVIDTKANK